MNRIDSFRNEELIFFAFLRQDMNRRFGEIDKRFEAIDKRFDGTDRDIDDLRS